MKIASAFGVVFLALVTLSPSPASAGSVKVSDAVAHFEDDQMNGRRYQVSMKIVNGAAANDRLYAARSRIAERAMIALSHETKGRMAYGRENNEQHLQTASVVLPAGATVTLSGDGSHVMLMNPKRKLKEGDTFRLTLFFEKAGRMTIDVTVVEREEGHAGAGG